MSLIHNAIRKKREEEKQTTIGQEFPIQENPFVQLAMTLEEEQVKALAMKSPIVQSDSTETKAKRKRFRVLRSVCGFLFVVVAAFLCVVGNYYIVINIHNFVSLDNEYMQGLLITQTKPFVWYFNDTKTSLVIDNKMLENLIGKPKLISSFIESVRPFNKQLHIERVTEPTTQPAKPVVNAPTPAQPAVESNKPALFRCEGIIMDGARSAVIINGRIRSVGEWIDGAEIIQIADQQVTIRYRGSKQILNIS